MTKALIGKVLGEEGGSSEGIVSAIQWAVDNGANVISMSLGSTSPVSSSDSFAKVSLRHWRPLARWRATV